MQPADKLNPSPQTLSDAFTNKARGLRPFYFIVVVWGEHYTDFLLNFCIASLLSPNNIPALLNSDNKFLIATTDEDWVRMQDRPIFQLLEQYVETVFIHIPSCATGTNKYVHMGIGHKLATHMAFEDRAYAAILTPDLIVSDGTVAAMQRHAVNGIQVVLTAALRFGEEPLFEHLKQIGLTTMIDPPSGKQTQPLVATGRQLVLAGIRSFHSETLCYEWESPYLADFPIALWWRVPGEDGVIVHSFSLAPLLIDYAAVEHHDTSLMDTWAIDGDYIYRNFGLNGKMHVVQDSDEMMLISWSPLSVDRVSLEPKPAFKNPLFCKWEKGVVLYNIMFHEQVDPLKLEIISKPFYWHAYDLNPKWDAVEKKAGEVIRNIRYAGPIRKIFLANIPKWRYLIKRHKEGLGVYLKSFFRYYYVNRAQVWNLIKQAARGDRAAKKRIKRSLQIFANYLIGDPNKK